MSERFQLPPPGFLKTEIIDLGPVIEPKYSDAEDWSRFRPAIETTPVRYAERSLAELDRRAAAAPEIALAAPEVGDLLRGKRYAIVSVGTRELDRDTEYPVVVIYDYDDDLAVEAVVDPDRRVVVRVTTSTNQPAVSAQEERHAIELVRADGRLPDNGIDVDTGAGLIIEDVDIHSPRHGHRLVDLRFGPLDRRMPTSFAVVDLSTDEVVRAGLFPEGLI
ncbi:hypothetical protein [Nocardia sp. NPDC057030]|uniref:hypothetical protein n=1 Tax=unclassified Nocardia TaxID=2637762 RepID=UPI00363C5AE1